MLKQNKKYVNCLRNLLCRWAHQDVIQVSDKASTMELAASSWTKGSYCSYILKVS